MTPKSQYLTPLPDKETKDIKVNVPMREYQTLQTLTAAFSKAGYAVDILPLLAKDFTKHLAALGKLAMDQGLGVGKTASESAPADGARPSTGGEDARA